MASQWTLALETSTLTSSVALLNGEVLAGEKTVHTPRGHARRLLADVDSLLAAHGLKPRDLELVVVSLGPGSFTGVRIGLSTARSLAWSAGVEIVGVVSLEVLAAGSTAPQALVAPVLDARRGEVFGALYRCGTAGLEPVLPPEVAPPEAFAERVSAAAGGEEFVFLGPGVEAYPAVFEALAAPAGPHHTLSASVAARLGQNRVVDSGFDALRGLEPIYLRRSDAELNFGLPTGEAEIEHR